MLVEFRADFGLLELLESLATTADCCPVTGFGHYSGSMIAFAADKGMLQTVQSQRGCLAIGLVVEEANAARGSRCVVTAGSAHVGGVDCPQQRPSAALCTEPAAAAVEAAPEPAPASDLSGPDRIAFGVPDPAALQLYWTLGCTG
jgi:hypothetical protein